MVNSTDLSSYHPPEELLFGKLRSTTEFIKMDEVGDGVSSSVMKAKDKKDNKIVAMKYLKPADSLLTTTREVFREVSNLKSLNHENIVKLHEVVQGTDINSCCLILEYCPVALDEYISFHKTEINLKQIKCIAKQMFSGLNHMHNSFITHRDLKPSNLMITAQGVLKIVDFGLSRKFTPTRRLTSPNVFTRWYQPPEILFRAPSYCNKADIWAAGCIIAELFLREPLFKGDSEISQINLMIDLLGTPTPNVWPDISRCNQTKNLQLKSQPFYRLTDKFKTASSQDAVEFMSKLLVYNPKQRYSADDGLNDAWMEQAPVPSKSIEVPLKLLSR